MSKKFDDAVLNAAELGSQDSYAAVDAQLAAMTNPDTPEVRSTLNTLLDASSKKISGSIHTAAFIIDASRFFATDYPELNALLPAAIKKDIKADINPATAVSALGIRSGIPPKEFNIRYKRMNAMRKGAFFYNVQTKSWGILGDIEPLTGNVTLLTLENKRLREAALPIAVESLIVFAASSDVRETLAHGGLKTVSEPAAKRREQLLAAACSPLSDETLKDSLESLLVPVRMTFPTFDKWWKSYTPEKSGTDAKRGIGQARSLQELEAILAQSPTRLDVPDHDIERLSLIFGLLKPTAKSKEEALWASVFCNLAMKIEASKIPLAFPRDKTALDRFWPPEPPKERSHPSMAHWANLKTSQLLPWARACFALRGQEYLAKLCLLLPSKAWSSAVAVVGPEAIVAQLAQNTKLANPEALLWIWENRSKGAEPLAKLLDICNIISAIIERDMHAPWKAAIRDLRKLLLDDVDFQMTVMDRNDREYFEDVLGKLAGNQHITLVERQSLVVKLCRHFPQFKAYVEAGNAKKLIGKLKDDAATDNGASMLPAQPITSFKSFYQKRRDLHRISTIEIPQNRAAIGIARAHGDLRENADYSAAKEQQGLLMEMRGTLEIGIANVNPTDFSDIKIVGPVVVGSSATIEFDDGTEKTYHVLGLWDSDPSRNYVSYETGLGRVLLGKSQGDKMKLPDGRSCVLKKVEKLSPEMIKELADEGGHASVPA